MVVGPATVGQQAIADVVPQDGYGAVQDLVDLPVLRVPVLRVRFLAHPAPGELVDAVIQVGIKCCC